MDKPYFELVSKYNDKNLLPKRATKFSAGYDFVVAQDIIVPSFSNQIEILDNYCVKKDFSFMDMLFIPEKIRTDYSLEEVMDITKHTGAKPTLVPTGVKAYIPKGYYL
jgi:dUTPase